MNDEFVDILDEFGAPTGEVKLKSEAHSKGLFHPTVHIWFYTQKSELLFQKRAISKKTFPGLWDVSVAGHISAGEKIIDSAIREIKEEIGLDILVENLEKIGIHKCIQRHNEHLTDCEFHHIFICELTKPLKSLKLQETEVDDIKLVPIEYFEQLLSNKHLSKDYVLLDNKYYDIVLNSIKKRLG